MWAMSLEFLPASAGLQWEGLSAHFLYLLAVSTAIAAAHCRWALLSVMAYHGRSGGRVLQHLSLLQHFVPPFDILIAEVFRRLSVSAGIQYYKN
jgi:hypothetical protein